MACSLNKEQVLDLYEYLHGEIYDRINNSKLPDFNITSLLQEVYTGVKASTEDPVKALLYAQAVPDVLQLVITRNSDINDYLIDKNFNFTDLAKMRKNFADLDYVSKAITPKPISAQKVAALVETDAFTPEDKDEDPQDIIEFRSKMYAMETAAPLTGLSSTGQDSTISDEGKFTNIADPEKNFSRGVRNKILKALRLYGELSASTLTYGNHTGFKLKVQKMNTLPGIQEGDYSQLLPSDAQLLTKGGTMLLWSKTNKRYEKRQVTPKEYREEFFNQGVTLSITDNDGNILYFDQDGNVTTAEEGRLIYIPFRQVNTNKDGTLWTPSLASITELTNRAAAAKALELGKIIRKNKDESDIAYNKRLIKEYNLEDYVKELKRTQQEELGNVKKIREYLQENPSESVMLDISGGSLGYYDNTVATPLSKFNITADDNIRPATENTVNKIEGRPYLTMPTVDTPIELRGRKIAEADPSVLINIAQVLARTLYKNKQKISNQDKVNYVTQFFYPSKGNNIFLRYNPSTDSIELSINGEMMKFPDTKGLSGTESSRLESELEDKILKGLDAVKNRLYFHVNDKVLGRNVAIYNVNGNVVTETEESYIDFLKDKVNAFAKPADDGRVYSLNGYFTFNIPQDQLDKIEGRTQEEIEKEKKNIDDAVKFAENNYPDNDNPSDPDDLGTLTRSRLLNAGATEADILNAIRWWKTSPLSGLVPLTQMINIINSDAWATFTKSGITLFNGSDFTSVYHESWHAFSQLLLTKQQKAKLYQEVKDSNITITEADGTKINSKDATSRQIEEYLAEEFRTFAMNGGKTTKKLPPVRKNLFQKIWDMLKNWFNGEITPAEEAFGQEYIESVQKYFNELYFAGKNPESENAFRNVYMPYTDLTKYYKNVQFGYLGSSPVPLAEDAQETMSYDEGMWVASNIDSLVSMWVDAQNLSRHDRLATARVFANVTNQVSAYNWSKKQLENKVRELSETYSKLSEEDKLKTGNQILANDIRVLNWAINNWGATDAVVKGTEEKGLLAFYRERSRFKDVMGKVDPRAVQDLNNESTEAVTTDAESISKGLRVGDRTGAELSIKEMANNSTLYLVRSLHKVDSKTGKKMLNRLGFPELVEFSEAWNALVRNLAGSLEPMDIYKKLGSLDLFQQKETLKLERDAKIKEATTEEAIVNIRKDYANRINIIDRQLLSKTSFPSFIQLADKLGPPTESKSDPIFDMWTDFWQDMNKARIPLVQMTNDKFVTIDEEGEITDVRFEYSVGRTAADLNRVQFDWLSEFKKQNPETNPYVIQNNNRENLLNLPQVFRDFALKTSAGIYVLDETKKMEFLRAIGIYLDDKPEISAIVNSDSTLEITRLFKAVEHLYHLGSEVYNPVRVLKEGFQYSYTLGNKKVSGRELSQTSRLEKLASLQARLSDSYSNLSVSTAENKKAYEHYLNNQITIAVSAINRAKNFKDVYDENGETPEMMYMNPLYNPGILSCIWLNSIFILDVPKSDINYGKKRKESAQVSATDVKLLLENISGYQTTERGLFFEKGIASASADRATKVIGDFHMFLDSGILEFMRHASKSAAFGARVKKIITYKGKREDNLYIDTNEFYRNVSQADNYKLTDIVLKYLQAEVLRAGIIRNNPDIYGKKITGYKNGTTLSIFDDILLDPESKAVLSDEFYNDLKGTDNDILALLNKPKYTALKYKVTQQIGKYFDKVISDYSQEFLKTEYINPELMRKVVNRITGDSEQTSELLNDADYKAGMRNAMVASFAVNSWIHNVESTFIIYGDIVQFDHSKEEFNKRNASSASNGYLFRTDKSAQDYINTVWGRPMLKKYYEKNPTKVGLDVLNRPYDGTLNTAVLKEPVFKSDRYDLIDEKFRAYYEDLFKSQGLKNAAKRTKAIDKILYGEGGTKDKPTGGVMEAFFKMKVADGQGYITFDSYRMLRKLEGKWLPPHEDAFQRIINGEVLRPDQLTKFFPPYKVIHSGFLKSKTLPINSLHKFSLMPLIPGAIGTDSSLAKLNEKMMEQGMDYVLYESGSKISHITTNGEGDAVYSDYENKVFNDNLVFTKNVIFAKNLRNQVDINMEWKGSTIFSTQLRKLAIQGLYNQGKPINAEAEAKAKRYIAIVDQLTELKRKEFLKEAGWTEDKDGNLSGSDNDLIAMVQDQLRNLGMADHEIEFIDVDPDTGEAMYDWSAHLSRERLERLVVALVNNRLIKQHMNGEPLVQVSEALFEKARFQKPTEEQLKQYQADQLQTYNVGEDGKTTAMQIKIAMQGDFINLFKLNNKEGKQIGIYDKVTKPDGDMDYVLNMDKSLKNLNSLLKDKEWLDKDNNRKKLQLISVRIPVQGLGQMEFMEVVEFLEPSAGNIIIAPYEIVAKSGADFDIDKMTVFMPKLTSQGKFLDTKFKSEEAIEKEISKLKEEKTKFLKGIDADASPSELEKRLKGTQKEQYAALRALGSQIALAKEERKQLMKNMRKELALVANSKRLDSDQKEVIAKGTDEELMDLIKELRRSRQLPKISPAADKLSQDSWELYKKLKGIRDQYKLNEEELAEIKKGNDKVREFKIKISDLNEQKRNFISVFENRMIESIVDILSMPENFVNLMRPNGTDLVKYVADELKEYVQERDHTISKKDGSKRAKGISPTRVLEYTYQLDKHQDNTVGKKSLGIAAQVNTANTLSQYLGGHLPAELTYTEVVVEKDSKGVLRKVKQQVKQPVVFRLNVNTMTVDGKEVVSISNIYDSTGITRIADIISQLMNGFVDVEKDPWVAYIQGNVEITPTLLALVETGVPFREAAYFVSNPLVREYVDQQRRIKSTFSGPMGSEIENINWFRGEALKNTLDKYGLESLPNSKEGRRTVIQQTVDKNMGVIAVDGKIPMETLERIVAGPDKNVTIKNVETPGLDPRSIESYTAFLHFIQIEDYISGIKNLRFKTNVDTKKDSTLFDAMLREIEINDLYNNEGIPEKMIRGYQEDSVISSFFIQDFLQKLWSKYFPTTSNDAVQYFLVNKFKNYNVRNNAENITGWKYDKIATEFKNALLPFLFQNYIKSFDLRKSEFYKGMNVKEKVPVTYVNALKSGVIVKDVNGEPTIFIDPAQVEKDWYSKVFESTAYAEEQGLSQLPAGVFSLKGQQSVKEYTNFLLEREYLRYMITEDAAKSDPQYMKILNAKRLSTARTEGENLADFNGRVETLSYEEFLRDKALDNTMNIYKAFYHQSESMGQRLMDILKNHPDLEKSYPILKQFAVRVGGRGVAGLQDLTNILLKDQRDIDTEISNSYHNALKRLADSSVIKVSDPKENEKISSYFRTLPLFAFMQSGMSKGEYSFTNVVPYKDYMNIMSEPIKMFKTFMEPKVFDKDSDELAKLIEEDNEFVEKQKLAAAPGSSKDFVHKYTFRVDAKTNKVFVYNTGILDVLWNKFLKQNSKENVSLRTRIQSYTIDKTPMALLDGAEDNAPVIKSRFVLKTATPGMYRLQSGVYRTETREDGSVNRVYTPITIGEVKKLATSNTDTVFFYDTIAELVNAVAANDKPLASKIELERAKSDPFVTLRQLPNAAGIRTTVALNRGYNPSTEEGLTKVKGMIKSDIDAAVQNSVGKKMVFPEDGIGQELLRPATTTISTQPAVSVVKTENISSKGSEFAKKLTNPYNNVRVTFRGREYKNSEHAYQTWKSGEFNEAVYNEGNKYDEPGVPELRKFAKPRGENTYEIMVEILTEKLKQHPDLVQGINERGGLDYIQQSTHNVIGDKFWESTGQNKFIEALAQAYQTVSTQAPVTQKVKGSIKLNIIEDWVQSGQATTTVRSSTYHNSFYKGDGLYTTDKGNLVDITYKGIVKLQGDRVVGNNVSYTKDEFAKAEGFGTWENFKKGAQYAGKTLIDGGSVHLYDIKPTQALVQKPSTVTVDNSEYRKEIFRYLSKLLYDNFGYINPGSQEIPSIMDIIAREQGVTDQDRENLRNRCSKL